MKKTAKQKGFTLVEMAMVLLITGIIMGSLSAMFKPYFEHYQIQTTRKRMDVVAKSLAMFAQNYGRLPCPADPNPATEPYGSPRGSGVNGDDVAKNKCGGTKAAHVGIVPFRALGLTEQQVSDGYGNLMTYSASPIMTYFDSTAATPDTNVGPSCDDGNIWQNGGNNRNIKKAHACCPLTESPVIGAIRVLDANGSTNSIYQGTNPIAYVLLSHGKNGDRAFLKQSATMKDITANVGAEESENRNGDNNLDFVDEPINTPRTDNYFDDIVMWRTNDELFSELGNNSCARP